MLSDSSVSRTRGRISRLVNANPDLNTNVTLTFKENFTDLREANKLFHKFIKRLKYRYSDFKYLAIPEFQQRGAVHYHMLINLKFVNHKEMAKIWREGFIQINKVKHINKLGKYISKYIGKDLFDYRYFKMRKILYSRNLEKPTVAVFKKDDVANFIKKDTENFEELFKRYYNSDYQGNVKYSLYKIKEGDK